jgi:hypothetical protein
MLVDILFDLILLSTVPPISTKQTTSSYLKQYNMQLFWELFVISTWKENYSYPVYAVSIMYDVTVKNFRHQEEIVYFILSIFYS